MSGYELTTTSVNGSEHKSLEVIQARYSASSRMSLLRREALKERDRRRKRNRRRAYLFGVGLVLLIWVALSVVLL